MVNFCPNCFAKSMAEKCNQCGYIRLNEAELNYMLKPGTILAGRYLLGRVLGAGGFGITYLAQNQSNKLLVAIKEYMPLAQAVRLGDGRCITASGFDNRQVFAHGIEVFKREAQTLKAFSGSENIVDVMDSFNENGTAYFVMEYLDGLTLGALSKASGGKLSLNLASEILKTMAQTLQIVHDKGMLHRDVSPENILITTQGKVKLIDFGATRFFVGEMSRSLSVILKAGFAPPEQYSGKGNQGPWTDLYALAATFYTMITGTRPPDAPDRLGGEPIKNLREYGLTNNLALAIEKSLSLDFRKRYPNMSSFLAALDDRQVASPKPSQALQIKGLPYVEKKNSNDRWLIPKNIPLIIGRAADKCNIVLDSINISRIHCEIRFDEKSALFYLKDLSTNGTFTNQGRLEQNKFYPLKAGDKFYILNEEITMEVGLC